MQYMLNNMSMIPKKGKADDVRMVAAMASGWRNETKMEPHVDRLWNASVSRESDSAGPGSSCLQAMEDCQCLLDILNACDFGTLECQGICSSPMTL